MPVTFMRMNWRMLPMMSCFRTRKLPSQKKILTEMRKKMQGRTHPKRKKSPNRKTSKRIFQGMRTVKKQGRKTMNSPWKAST